MEEYEEVGSDALVAYNACDASAATAGRQEHEALSQSLQIVRQLELEAAKESKKQASGKRERSLVKASILDKKEETPPQSQENKNFATTQISLSTKSSPKKQNYALIVVSKPAKFPKQP